MSQDNQAQTAPQSSAAYVFKRYLAGGGSVFEVRRNGKTLSLHATVEEATRSEKEINGG